MSERGELIAIWVKPARRAPMEPRQEVVLEAGRGIAGNRHQGGRRQVTLLDADAWQGMAAELGAAVPPEARRANLLLSRLPLAGITDRVLCVGEARLLVLGETSPCRRMEEVHPGLQRALEPGWRGGSYGQILQGGRIRVGDPVAWEEGNPPA